MTLKNISGERRYFSFGKRGYFLDDQETIVLPYSTPELVAHVARYVDQESMEITVPPTAEEVDPLGLNPALGAGGDSGPLHLIRCLYNADAAIGHNAFTIEFLADAGPTWLMYDVTGDNPVLISDGAISGPVVWDLSPGEIAFATLDADMTAWWNAQPTTHAIVDFQHQNGGLTLTPPDYCPHDRAYITIPGKTPPISYAIDEGSGVQTMMRSDVTSGYVIIGSDADFNDLGVLYLLR